MSLLYKDKEDQIIELVINRETAFGNMTMDFYSDCGKHGTSEALDSFKLTPERLLQILQEREDITDNEL